MSVAVRSFQSLVRAPAGTGILEVGREPFGAERDRPRRRGAVTYPRAGKLTVEEILRALWRRKWTVIATVLVWGALTHATWYAYAGERPELGAALRVGAEVDRGQQLGGMGHSSGGYMIPKDRAHLHFEIGVAMTRNFQAWYDRQKFGSKNEHGMWNGMNLVGIDPLAFFNEWRAGRIHSVRDFFAQMETAVRLKLNLVVLILEDKAYGMIRWKQAVDRFADFGLGFGNPDFVRYAESYGAKGRRVETADGLAPALEAAFQDGGVQLVVVPVDYSENVRVLVEELAKTMG